MFTIIDGVIVAGLTLLGVWLGYTDLEKAKTWGKIGVGVALIASLVQGTLYIDPLPYIAGVWVGVKLLNRKLS